MPQPRKSLPRYLKRSDGKGRIVWTDSAGRRQEKVLPGPYNSPESLEAFARLQLELAVRPAAPVLRVTDHGPTVSEVLVAYLKFAANYHDKGSDLEAVKVVVKMLRELYGPTPAAAFGPLALKAVRQAMVNRKWSRQYTNRMTRRVVAVFRWAVSEELLPEAVYRALKTVGPLEAGKTEAKEAPARLPADPDHVAAALPFLPAHVRALVSLIRATGMRPSEACRMTLGDIDRTGPVWLYCPRRHKLTHKGKHRTVALGETAQAVIVAHLDGRVPAPDEALFSPRRQLAERYERMRAGRKSKVQPSQANRRKAAPKKQPGEWFTPGVVCRAVAKACKKAKVPAWSPYMLRHLVGAELRERFSLEHVRAALGHSHASMSAHYAKGADLKLATEVAAKAG